jgi:hypothetical protein
MSKEKIHSVPLDVSEVVVGGVQSVELPVPQVEPDTIAVVQEEESFLSLPTLSTQVSSSLQDEDIASIEFEEPLSEVERSSWREEFSDFTGILTMLIVRSLFGLLSFYRRYVPGFALLTALVSDLVKSFSSRIKEIFSAHPVLQLPRLDHQFVLRTDASSVGLGAALLQESENTLHPVAFASKKLLPRETRYSTIERECLAIVWAVGKFSKFLWGVDFVLQTDHKPLTYIQTCRFKNARILRWSLSLQEFKFRVEPIPGTQNVFADLLSRADQDQSVP